jgi:hypothetical protein
MSNDLKHDDRKNSHVPGQQPGAGKQVQGQSKGQPGGPNGSKQVPGSSGKIDHDKHGSDCGCGSK